MPSFGDQLRHTRKALALTLDDLAQRAGVDRMTVQRIETGKTDVRLQTLRDLLRAVGLDLMVVPAALRQDVEQFLQSHGRILGQPTGVDAPASIVDTIVDTVTRAQRTP